MLDAFEAKSILFGIAPRAPTAASPGRTLDRYELLCPIGEGGMARVWFARRRDEHGFERLVAVKTLLPKFAHDARYRQMFLQEASIASRIEHVNVARILDVGEEHGVLFLAMEYVDGDPLWKLVRTCRQKDVDLPIGVFMRILSDACAGLHEAHELCDRSGRPLEIVHRDVSPHNILVSTTGVAKLIDFGIAKERARIGDDTNSGVFKGRIRYMAPEQALGGRIDRRADVWAVGSILYHHLAGKPPYGGSLLTTLRLLDAGQSPEPLPPTVHPSIAEVVRKALAYAPEDRYATAAELRDALERAMIAVSVPTSVSDVAEFVAELDDTTNVTRLDTTWTYAPSGSGARVVPALRWPRSRTLFVAVAVLLAIAISAAAGAYFTRATSRPSGRPAEVAGDVMLV
jgi:serine/threonine-protein kinase